MSINTDSVSLKILQEQIQTTRNRMQQLWDEKGYTDTEVLNASIELDYLLNKLQQMTGLLRKVRYIKHFEEGHGEGYLKVQHDIGYES